MTAIAFLGMGLMGNRMSQRLLSAGYDVSVWNRTALACKPLLKQGAKLFDFATHTAQQQIICLCLADDQAVEMVTMQLMPYLKDGQVIIDFSSLSVATTQRLAKQVATKQVAWIDAPVSGGVMGAEHGNLIIFAGGDAAIIQSMQPLFDCLAQRVSYMGQNGSGQATKICNQLIVAATSTLVAEAVLLAEQSGVDSTQLASALAGGFADSKPLQILAPRMAQHQFEPVQWKVQTLSKDLNNAIHLATQQQLNLPVATQALQQLAMHANQGYQSADLASLILHYQTLSHFKQE